MRSVQGMGGTLLSWRICMSPVHVGRRAKDYSGCLMKYCMEIHKIN